jgi:hypothetical protein
MSAEFKPQAFLCYDFTVCDVSIKGSQPISTFKRAADRCDELNGGTVPVPIGWNRLMALPTRTSHRKQLTIVERMTLPMKEPAARPSKGVSASLVAVPPFSPYDIWAAAPRAAHPRGASSRILFGCDLRLLGAQLGSASRGRAGSISETWIATPAGRPVDGNRDFIRPHGPDTQVDHRRLHYSRASAYFCQAAGCISWVRSRIWRR